jgi:hypothetical protein
MVLQMFLESPVATTHAMVVAIAFLFCFLVIGASCDDISRQMIFAAAVESVVVFERKIAFVFFEGMQLPKA